MSVSAPARDKRSNKPRHSAKQGLSRQRVRLLELMQSVNFGRIDGLQVVDGEPVLDLLPPIAREYKFGGDNGPRVELGDLDFLLKQQVVELFAFFDKLRDGVIEVLEIKHGLPFRMVVREVPA